MLVHLAGLLYFTAASLAMTWPLALHLRSAMSGMGDALYFAFLIRWFQRSIFTLGISPYPISWLNYPAGWNLASTDTSFATTLPGVPFALLWGDAAGYNLAMLLTFILSGWAMFAWVRRLSGSALAGLVAGTIFTFLPYRMAHYAIGHLNLSGTAWFPLYFWGLYDLLRARRWDWRPALLCGAMLGLISLTSMYYLMMTAVITAVFCLAYWLFADRRVLFRLAFWLNAALAGLASLPLLVLGAGPFVAFSRAGGIASRSAEYVSQYSASPTDYLLPFAAHWLWWPWIAHTYMRERWVEASLYVGAVSLALAVLAWIAVRQPEQRALLKIVAFTALAAFVLSLGVYFTWQGQPLQVHLPGREPFAIPLPDLLLLQRMPFFNKMRALLRFGFFVPFFCALSAGLGAAWLLQRLKTRPTGRAALTLLLLLLVALDFGVRPQTSFVAVGPRPVDRWLAAQPGSGVVAQFPFTREVDQDLVYAALYHGKPYIGGFYNANTPDQYWLIQPDLATFPSPASLAKLRELGVHYILVEEKAYKDPAGILAACRDLGMPLLTRLDGISVFALPPIPGGKS